MCTAGTKLRMQYPTILAIVLVGFMAADLAPEPDITDAGTGGAQSWYTDYLAQLEAERIAKLKGKENLEATTLFSAYKTCINF